MKLRIEGNSLRFRLRQSEVARLADGGELEAAVQFGDGTFRYRLQPGNRPQVKAAYRDNTIEISIPSATAREWANTDQVAISAEQPTPFEPLLILIEKDFQCLHKTEAANADAFPNPLALTET